ncbi:thioredoxin family protein [Erythrobacteraceae bacterium WH01K]|nr:thioredoxin family protein [Erythrobacteraceae bacterium WH01K]
MLAIAVAGCATTSHPHSAHPYEARPFEAAAAARPELETALERAKADGKLTLAVFGANWCHDSRALAGLLETERFRALTDAHYEMVFVDVGTPQNGKGRNLELGAELGVEGIEGTPTVIVIGRRGATLNVATAKLWRDAASRNPDAVYMELFRFAQAGL